jgi:hypothetical protein
MIKSSLAIAIALIAVFCAAIGIIIWQGVTDDYPIAEIQKVDIKHSDDSSLDLKHVPPNTDFLFEITYRARYKELKNDPLPNGSIDLTQSSGDGRSSSSLVKFVRSSDKLQVWRRKVNAFGGEGQTYRFTARIQVVEDHVKQWDEKRIEYYVTASSKPHDKEYFFKQFKEQATERVNEAVKAVEQLASMGINNSDLIPQLQDATGKLRDANTPEEYINAESAASDVVHECSQRSTAHQTCQDLQAKIRKLIINYYNANGRLPNSISDLPGSFSCLSGGVYTFSAPSGDPSTLRVSCSVHGTL